MEPVRGPRRLEDVVRECSDRLTISVPECARRLGISRASAYQAAQQGQIPTIRIGHRLIVPLAALDRFLSGEAPRDGSGRGKAA